VCKLDYITPQESIMRLIMTLYVLGIDGNMCHNVAYYCCTDSPAFLDRKDVFCAMPGYRSIPKKLRGKEELLQT